NLQWILSTGEPGWSYQDTGVSIPEKKWSHTAISYDGAGVRAYVNGELVSTIFASGALVPFPAPGVDFRIGCRQTGDALFFAGSIAEVVVYSRALPGYDIQLLAGNTPSAASTWISGALPAGVDVS